MLPQNSQNRGHPAIHQDLVTFRAVRPVTVARHFGAKVKFSTKVTKIYRKIIISAVILGFLGIYGISLDALNILDVPVSILVLKFDLKIF